MTRPLARSLSYQRQGSLWLRDDDAERCRLGAFQLTPVGNAGSGGATGATGGTGPTGATGPTGPHGPVFAPSDVPAIAAGYYWLPRDATGLGTAGFVVPEGNAHSAFNFVQATVAGQPTQLTENGGVQFRMRNAAALTNQSSLTTAGAVVAGWTGATYLAGWVRLPDAAGIITTAGFGDQLFRHGATNQQRLTLFPGDGTPDTVQLQLFPVAAGTGNGTKRFDNATIFAGANWVWLECMFDPLLELGGSTDADKFKLFSEFTQRAIVGSTGAAITGTTIANSTAVITMACIAAGFANGDTTDWASWYYGNGLPTLNQRIHLRNHYAPVADDWSLLAA